MQKINEILGSNSSKCCNVYQTSAGQCTGCGKTEEINYDTLEKSVCCNADMYGGVQCLNCGADGRKFFEEPEPDDEEEDEEEPID